MSSVDVCFPEPSAIRGKPIFFLFIPLNDVNLPVVFVPTIPVYDCKNRNAGFWCAFNWLPFAHVVLLSVLRKAFIAAMEPSPIPADLLARLNQPGIP